MHVKKKVNMQDIADEVGTSKMTVSRVLRGQAHAAGADLRRRIQKAARELGYVPNPMVSALMSELRLRHKPGKGAVIVWIMSKNALDHPIASSALEGARARAASLGFQFEVIQPSSIGDSGLRLNKMIRARGIQGCIFSLWLTDAFMESVDFVSMACATHDFRFAKRFGLPFVCVDHSLYSSVALEAADARGYRRPGFVSTLAPGDPFARKFLGPLALHAMDHNYTPLPVYVAGVEPHPAAFLHWAQENQPDVILLLGDQSILEMDEQPPKVRDRFGWILLGAQPHRTDLAQMTHKFEEMGSSLVDRVATSIYYNARGSREEPELVFTDVTLRPGKSLPHHIAEYP